MIILCGILLGFLFFPWEYLHYKKQKKIIFNSLKMRNIDAVEKRQNDAVE
jgi:hypothetical protein